MLPRVAAAMLALPWPGAAAPAHQIDRRCLPRTLRSTRGRWSCSRQAARLHADVVTFLPDFLHAGCAVWRGALAGSTRPNPTPPRPAPPRRATRQRRPCLRCLWPLPWAALRSASSWVPPSWSRWAGTERGCWAGLPWPGLLGTSCWAGMPLCWATPAAAASCGPRIAAQCESGLTLPAPPPPAVPHADRAPRPCHLAAVRAAPARDGGPARRDARPGRHHDPRGAGQRAVLQVGPGAVPLGVLLPLLPPLPLPLPLQLARSCGEPWQQPWGTAARGRADPRLPARPPPQHLRGPAARAARAALQRRGPPGAAAARPGRGLLNSLRRPGR
jgi:hypothetical protein